jgi:hypothetical protein
MRLSPSMRNVAWSFDGAKIGKKINKKTKGIKNYPDSGNNIYLTFLNMMVVIYLGQ